MQPQSVIPQFRITNAAKSLAFYVDGLGFAIDWKHQFESGYPMFFQITRASQTIFLSEHTGDGEVGGAAYFLVPDVDACFQDFRSRRVEFSKVPENTPWGTREMLLIDPDGNRLRFASERVTSQ
jgi:catechol 2,3-dioxygenase-like lactoylglutathione lyase family enzyme